MIKKIAVLLFMVSVLGFADENADYITEDLPPVERPRVALVLSGGGAKGFAHIAVLEMIEELEIPVDIIIGTSAGAIIGGLYSVGYSPEMMKDILFDLDWASFFQDSPVSPFENVLRTENLFPLYNSAMQNTNLNYSKGETAYTLFKTLTAKIPSHIDFDTLPIPFRAGVVEIPEGRSVLLREGDLAEAIRASMSIPGVFAPLSIGGTLYIDGGTLDNLPIREAKELGYDIIIASELYPGPKSIGFSTLEVLGVPDLMLELYFNSVSREQYPLADTVIKFDLQDYSIMDFYKAKEIYSLARNERETMRAELEKVKALLSSHQEGASFYPEPPVRISYNEFPVLIPEDIVVTGALQRDLSYIESYFVQYIKGKPLEPKNITIFMEAMYKTGNYQFVEFRPYMLQEKTLLELNLYPRRRDSFVFLVGGNYRGIKGISSNDFISKANLQWGIQFHGLSGLGSVLSLEGTVLGDFSLGIQYMQPLTSFSFLSARAEIEIVSDSDIVVVLFTEEASEERNFFLFSGEVEGGVFLDRHSIKGGPLFFSTWNGYAEGEEIARAFQFEKNYSTLGLGLSYAYDNLDYTFMPSRGVSVTLENRFYLPLPLESGKFFNLITFDLEAALPLGSGFSLVVGAFVGTNLGPGLPSGFSQLGYNDFDQRYFPNVSSNDGAFPRKVATSLALQFQPWQDFFVFGGQLIFSLSASVGELFNEWADFSPGNLIWNVSLNAGLRISNNYGITLKIGVGSNGSSPLTPFIALDIGQQPRFRR
jgi:NTE family protein